MKVKATNTLKNYLQEQIPHYRFYLLKMGIEQYRITVDYDIFRNETDFNSATNKMSVLQVVYPSDYYASPKYLTTRDLNRIFSRSDKTAEGFIKAVREEIEI